MKVFMKLFTQYSYKSIADPIAVLGHKSESYRSETAPGSTVRDSEAEMSSSVDIRHGPEDCNAVSSY